MPNHPKDTRHRATAQTCTTTWTQRLRRGWTRGARSVALGLGLASLCSEASAHSWATQTGGFASASNLSQTVTDLSARHVDIDEMARDASGEWIIVAEGKVYSSANFPQSIVDKTEEFIAAGKTVDAIAIAPDGNWVLVAENLWWRTNGVPLDLRQKISDRLSAGKRVTEIAFDMDGEGWTIISGSWAYSSHIPSDLYSAIIERHKSKRTIKQISIGDDGRWLLIADDWYASNDVNPTCIDWLQKRQQAGLSLDRFLLGPGDSWVLYSNGVFSPAQDNKLAQLEHSLGGGEENIWERMAAANVRGVSIAVVENNQVKYARGYGEIEADTQYWVRADTPFDAASLSKAVAAATIMTAVDDGVLGLDDSVSDHDFPGSDLWHWQRLAPTYTSVTLPADEITLRRTLSHTASLVPHSSQAYDRNSPVPLLWEMLLGQECDGPNCAYGSDHMVWYDPSIGPPGSAEDYSGGGFMVAQAMATSATGESLPDLAQDRIFGPLELADSTFDQPLDPAFATRAAKPHHADGTVIPYRDQHYFPWSAAGGLYASPSDYARILIMLNQFGVGGNGTSILSEASVQEMLTDQTPAGTGEGLGVRVSQSVVTQSNNGYYAHGGTHNGQFKARMGSHPTKKEAIVIMINGGHDAAHDLREDIYNRFKEIAGW